MNIKVIINNDHILSLHTHLKMTTILLVCGHYTTVCSGRYRVLVVYNTACPLYTTLCLVSHDGRPSLDIEPKVLNVHIFIASFLITAQPDLDIISGWLRKVLTEPGALVTASLKSS